MTDKQKAEQAGTMADRIAKAKTICQLGTAPGAVILISAFAVAFVGPTLASVMAGVGLAALVGGSVGFAVGEVAEGIARGDLRKAANTMCSKAKQFWSSTRAEKLAKVKAICETGGLAGILMVPVGIGLAFVASNFGATVAAVGFAVAFGSTLTYSALKTANDIVDKIQARKRQAVPTTPGVPPVPA